MAWVGVALFFVLTPWLCVYMRRQIHSSQPASDHFDAKRILSAGILLCVATALALIASPPATLNTKYTDTIAATPTNWGRYPMPGSIEQIQRIEKIGSHAQLMSQLEPPMRTLIYPESIIGVYEPHLNSVIEWEVLRHTKPKGTTVVIGLDTLKADGGLVKSAAAYYADGTTAYVRARNAVLIAEWWPFGDQAFRYDFAWLSPTSMQIGGGIKARFVFCHEEYMPALNLLSEALEPTALIISMSNLWSAHGVQADFVQGAHMEGFTRLFGRKLLRSVNYSQTPPPGWRSGAGR
jgi:hypothetical protein